jgi:Tol biopolymer transport system component
VVYRLEDVNHKTSLWKVSINGGVPIQMTDFESALPTISPDGKSIAFRYGSTNADEQPKIGLMPVDGSGPVQALNLSIAANARYFRWSSDERSIIYIDSTSGSAKLFIQPLNGGESKLLVDFKNKRIFSFDVSNNRNGIVMSLGNESSEALMITNFE